MPPFSARKEWFSLTVAAFAAFCVYTCMFAFRKPFTAANYTGETWGGTDYKTWLVIAQTIGYTLSKFYGIRFIAALAPGGRFRIILFFLGMAWLSLLGFALTSAPWNIFFLLLNGFPLGMIYGLVFGYLEGRRTTELLGAVLASSFIFASGFTQSVGKWVMLEGGIDQWWMPFLTGGIFVLPAIFFTWLLNRTPQPTQADKDQRTERKPMNKAERSFFLKTFFPGLVLLVTTYVLLTVIRDYRSNFASNMWTELGYGSDTSIFTRTEIPATLVTLVFMGMLIFIKKNIRALLINHWIVMAGFLLSIIATLLFQYAYISPVTWMMLLGIGLYMGYVPFNCMLFDRLIASFRHVSNAGFLIYLADSFGYLGSDMVLVAKNFLDLDISWTQFFIRMIFIFSAAGFVMTGIAGIYFKRKYAGERS
jgi:MFS family permease